MQTNDAIYSKCSTISKTIAIWLNRCTHEEKKQQKTPNIEINKFCSKFASTFPENCSLWHRNLVIKLHICMRVNTWIQNNLLLLCSIQCTLLLNTMFSALMCWMAQERIGCIKRVAFSALKWASALSCDLLILTHYLKLFWWHSMVIINTQFTVKILKLFTEGWKAIGFTWNLHSL